MGPAAQALPKTQCSVCQWPPEWWWACGSNCGGKPSGQICTESGPPLAGIKPCGTSAWTQNANITSVAISVRIALRDRPNRMAGRDLLCRAAPYGDHDTDAVRTSRSSRDPVEVQERNRNAVLAAFLRSPQRVQCLQSGRAKVRNPEVDMVYRGFIPTA